LKAVLGIQFVEACKHQHNETLKIAFCRNSHGIGFMWKANLGPPLCCFIIKL
jgi:hypothetical protein